MLIWHPQAREDLLEIYTKIGRENPAAAESFYSTMEKKTEALVRYPRLGVRRADIRPSARMLVEGPISCFMKHIQTRMRVWWK